MLSCNKWNEIWIVYMTKCHLFIGNIINESPLVIKLTEVVLRFDYLALKGLVDRQWGKRLHNSLCYRMRSRCRHNQPGLNLTSWQWYQKSKFILLKKDIFLIKWSSFMVHSNDWLKFSHDKTEYNVSFDGRKPILPAKKIFRIFYFHSTTLTCIVFHYSWHSRL